jgi:hypothetical protein
MTFSDCLVIEYVINSIFGGGQRPGKLNELRVASEDCFRGNILHRHGAKSLRGGISELTDIEKRPDSD